jgi:hypothetical protein
LGYLLFIHFFLSSSLFLGSILNILTRYLLKFYIKIWLYTPIYIIYDKVVLLKQIKPFINQKIEQLYGEITNENIVLFWSEVYFELEATQKINTSKAYQSFYYFFRNFFTLSVILFIPLLFQLFLNDFSVNHLLFFSINFSSIFFSLFAARWNREKMVERVFWTYYSLNKNI